VSTSSRALLTCERRVVAPNHQRVVAIGEVDLATGLRLTDALRAAHADARHVVLDLDGTTFMDMSGVRILLAAAEHARTVAGTFEIVHATAPVARMLALTGADRALTERPADSFPPAMGAGDRTRTAPPSRPAIGGPRSLAAPQSRSARL
jgi:anti-anti-sigma factor